MMMRGGHPASTGRRTSARGRGTIARSRGAPSVGRAATLALLLGAACSAPTRPAGTVVYASGADLESLDPLVTVHPLSRQVQRFALFVTLARFDGRLVPRPYLAREWRWSGDRRTLTFVLNAGVPWHDGRPTTARDAAFTLDAARDPATGYARAADLAGVTEVSAPDDTTLVVRYATPQATFPAILCELPVLPEHLLGGVPRASLRRAAFERAPVGNGPFRFDSRTTGQRWVFVRNGAFPPALGGPPRLARFVVAVVDEPTTKFAGLVSGELDVAGIAPTAAPLVRRDPSLRVATYPTLFSNALVFNAARPPLDDPRVRRALSLALDRRRIVDGALGGLAIPATSIVPPDAPLALGGTVDENPARADSLLDAAGWRRGPGGRRARGGQTLALTLVTVGSGDNAVEQLVQADFAARGVALEIRQLEMGAFLAAARAPRKSYDVLLTGIPGDLSLAYLAGMFDSRLAGGALDYAGYHTPRLDSLFAAVRTASDERALGQGWAAVQRQLAADVPAAWIYHSRGVQGVARRLRGVTMDLRGELATLHDWTVDAPPSATRTAHR
ncbi:MAG TPA: peptide ABC transporter substrate-binding protein [Gemmatimonadaceae bacterium]|nr:peptide ABC transporter substrate-binding protein [Gemmatimonadaceae bacterium]